MKRFYHSLNTRLIGLLLLLAIALGNRPNVFAGDNIDASAQVVARSNTVRLVETDALAMGDGDLELTGLGISHADALMLVGLDEWDYSATRFADSDYNSTSAINGNRAVPVPAAVWLFGSGLFGLAGLSRCSKRQEA